MTTATVSVMRDRFSNESRGIGFAEMEDPDVEHAVEACNGKQFIGLRNVLSVFRA